jgi:hypothetical protein
VFVVLESLHFSKALLIAKSYCHSVLSLNYQFLVELSQTREKPRPLIPVLSIPVVLGCFLPGVGALDDYRHEVETRCNEDGDNKKAPPPLSLQT